MHMIRTLLMKPGAKFICTYLYVIGANFLNVLLSTNLESLFQLNIKWTWTKCARDENIVNKSYFIILPQLCADIYPKY
jgi:hypothetical protein